MTQECCFFIRHGETDWNCDRRMMGWTDIPLNETGIKQAREAQLYLKDLGIQTICTSPLQRARQTADLLNDRMGVDIIEIAELKEVGWGELEGQIRLKSGGQMLEDARQGRHAENAEPYDVFERRVVSGLKQALTYPGPVLIVSHGGVFWTLATYFNWPTEKVLSNCEPVQIFFPQVYGDWVVRKMV